MAANLLQNPQLAKFWAEKLRKRNKLKWFSYHLAKMLWYGNPESEIRDSYKNTFFCSNVIEVTEEGLAKAKYCKNRWCPICQRNKMGLMINTYGPRLQQCEDLWFLTLTKPNVPADQLKDEIKKYQALWRVIANTNVYRKAMKRGVIGIRKMECTYHAKQFLEDGRPDPWYDTYHPHLHLLISEQELAYFIISEWKRLNPEISEDAQKIEKLETAGGYLEVFKYFTKLIAKDSTGRRFFDPIHMDVIFRAMRGNRVYFRLGTTAAWGCQEISEEDEEQAAVIETDATPSFYRWLESDEFFGFYDVETGETLTELPKKGRIFDIITDSEKQYGEEGKKQGSAPSTAYSVEGRTEEGDRDEVFKPSVGSGRDARRVQGQCRGNGTLGRSQDQGTGHVRGTDNERAEALCQRPRRGERPEREDPGP